MFRQHQSAYLLRSFLSRRRRSQSIACLQSQRRDVPAMVSSQCLSGCRGMASYRTVSSLPAPYHHAGFQDSPSRMNMNRGLRQSAAAAAPFWNNTAVQTLASFSTTSIPTTDDQKQDQEQDPQHEEAFAAISDMDTHHPEVGSDFTSTYNGNDYDYGNGADEQAASPSATMDDPEVVGSDFTQFSGNFDDYGNGADEKTASPSTTTTPSTTASDSSATQIVTTFDMRRACSDILECLPDPESNSNARDDRSRSSSHRPKLTWKYQWQRASSSAKYQLEQHRTRSLTAAYADADGMAWDVSANANNNDEAIGMALALLRVLPEDLWKSFDALGLEDDDDDFDDDDEVVGEEKELFVTTEYPERNNEYPDDAHLAKEDEGDEQHGDDDDDYDEIARLLDMVADAKVGRVVLKTSDYNAILGRLAISPEMTVERILESAMQTYQQMIEMSKVGMTDSGPDATTYELLMHTLNRRLSSSNTAVEIMQEMMRSQGVGWTPQTMKAAFQLCQGRNDLKSARIVLKDVVADKSRSFKIPSGVLLAYLDMLKSEDAQNEALDLLKLSMEEQTGDRSQGLDDVLVSCIRWPQRDRNGQSNDNTLFLSKILRILEADASNPAGFHVWKQFIVECAKRARQNVSRWELVQRVLKKLSTDNPRFWPDHLLLKCGLEASEFLLDSELASTLIVRTLEHDQEVHTPRTDNAFESDLSHFLSDSKEFSFGIKAETNTEDSPNDAFESDLSHFMSDSKQFSFGITAETDAEDPSNPSVQDGTVGREWADGPSFNETKSAQFDAAADKPTHEASLELPPEGRSRVVFRDILKGMEICVHGSDMRSGRLILDSVDAFPEAVPVAGKRALYSLALKGFAAIGDCDSAEQVLSSMVENDLKPGEDAFGAVVYSFAGANQPSKARDFLEGMLTGTYGDNVKPGASCYNAAILSYVRAGAWNDVLSLYETMKESHVKANPTTFNGVLLASHQVGGSSQVQALAKELLSTSAAMGQESCELILDILIPELQQSDTRVDTRKQLRLLVDQDPTMAQVYLNLNRALHTAETEQSRKPSNGLSNEDIAQRRDTAWRDVLRIILSCAQATEDQKSQAS